MRSRWLFAPDSRRYQRTRPRVLMRWGISRRSRTRRRWSALLLSCHPGDMDRLPHSCRPRSTIRQRSRDASSPPSSSLLPWWTDSACTDWVCIGSSTSRGALKPAAREETAAIAELLKYVREKDQTMMELSGQLGFVQVQLSAAEEQIRLLQAPKDEPVEETTGQESVHKAQERRSFWQRVKDRAYGRRDTSARR